MFYAWRIGFNDHFLCCSTIRVIQIYSQNISIRSFKEQNIIICIVFNLADRLELSHKLPRIHLHFQEKSRLFTLMPMNKTPKDGCIM
ncbi:hypothetical protein L1987_77860 [Smallanthus sonchifolius]|uniref:Uncharacterized protein n=1 Tax=Smallanthus sonchifolius TaxID=185202 RepID=A0ACB8ZB32_9ASTR|nr:hypothetical protein L1987_77860 [Smallanthus sonchifolius]